MGLFTRQSGAHDFVDHEYVLTGCPLVAEDDMVVLVDATVRLEVRRDREVVEGYDPTDEAALHAVFVLVLRLLAARRPSDDLLTGRAEVAEALEQGLAFAPVATGLTARVTRVEVAPYDADAAVFRHEVRPVSG